jgi:hypothetical protein
MANILAAGTTATSSSTFTLDGTTETTLKVIGATGGSFLPDDELMFIEYQGSDNGWVPFSMLTTAAPIVVLKAAGTFRVRRVALLAAVGCDRD